MSKSAGLLKPLKCIDESFSKRTWMIVKFPACFLVTYVPVTAQCLERNAGVERAPPSQTVKGSNEGGADTG